MCIWISVLFCKECLLQVRTPRMEAEVHIPWQEMSWVSQFGSNSVFQLYFLLSPHHIPFALPLIVIDKYSQVIGHHAQSHLEDPRHFCHNSLPEHLSLFFWDTAQHLQLCWAIPGHSPTTSRLNEHILSSYHHSILYSALHIYIYITFNPMQRKGCVAISELLLSKFPEGKGKACSSMSLFLIPIPGMR